MSESKFSELEGKEVLTQDGRVIGKVEDMIVDIDMWYVPKLVVKLDRDLLEAFHMKKPMFGTQTHRVPTTFISGISDRVILHKKLEELTAMAEDAAPSEESDAAADE